MKKIISAALAALLVLLCVPLTGCSKKEKLIVCNWGEYISDGADGSLDVIAQFEKEFNCKVEYVTAESNETLYSNMQSGGVKYDVIFPSDYMAERMIREGMIQKLNYDNIPNFSNIMDQFKNLDYDKTNEYTVPYFWGTVGLIYNESLLSEEDVKKLENAEDWSMLWSKNYPNQIMIFNNPRDAFAIAQKQLGFSQNTEDPEEIRQAAALLKEQKWVFAMDEFFELMPSGGLAMATYYAGDYMTVAEENEDLKFVIPACGTNIFNDVMCIPQQSQNKELAEKFINFMLRADIGRANTEYVYYSTPNNAVLQNLDEELRESEIAYPERKENWEAFADLSPAATELMRDLWVEITTGNK